MDPLHLVTLTGCATPSRVRGTPGPQDAVHLPPTISPELRPQSPTTSGTDNVVAQASAPRRRSSLRLHWDNACTAVDGVGADPISSACKSSRTKTARISPLGIEKSWRVRRPSIDQPLCVRHPSAAFVQRDYDLLRELGRGSFGHCHLMRERATGQETVCKVVNTQGMSSHVLEQMKEEVNALRTLDHPHIVKIFEYAQDLGHCQLILILEYIPGGSCEQLLRYTKQPLSESFVAQIVRQILSALVHCHGREIIHRDLKPAHFMLMATSVGQCPDIKIIDFGLCHVRTKQSGSIVSKVCVGTLAYMAPEVIADASTAAPIDIWALAVSILEMLTAKNAFTKGSRKETRQAIAAYKDLDTLLCSMGRSSAPLELPSQASKAFINAMLQPHPDARSSAEELASHSWFSWLQVQDACRRRPRSASAVGRRNGRASPVFPDPAADTAEQVRTSTAPANLKALASSLDSGRERRAGSLGTHSELMKGDSLRISTAGLRFLESRLSNGVPPTRDGQPLNMRQ